MSVAAPVKSTSPLTLKFPVKSAPVAVILNLSVLLIWTFTSFEVSNLIYSWSAAVPIFVKPELLMEMV